MKLNLHDKAKLASDIVARVKLTKGGYESKELTVLFILQIYNISTKRIRK